MAASTPVSGARRLFSGASGNRVGAGSWSGGGSMVDAWVCSSLVGAQPSRGSEVAGPWRPCSRARKTPRGPAQPGARKRAADRAASFELDCTGATGRPPRSRAKAGPRRASYTPTHPPCSPLHSRNLRPRDFLKPRREADQSRAGARRSRLSGGGLALSRPATRSRGAARAPGRRPAVRRPRACRRPSARSRARPPSRVRGRGGRAGRWR